MILFNLQAVRALNRENEVKKIPPNSVHANHNTLTVRFLHTYVEEQMNMFETLLLVILSLSSFFLFEYFFL